MASYDGTNKASAGKAQSIDYYAAVSPQLQKRIDETLAGASPEAVAFYNKRKFRGPDIECDASTLTEDEWQARREHTVGGSDCSAIFGVNHYKTNLECYYQKTGQKPAIQEEETAKSKLNKLWGHIAEEYIDAWLAERYPYNQIITDTNIYTMPGMPYITANIDRMMRKPDGTYCLVEMKTTSPFNKEAWANGMVPLPYVYQVRQYMAIMDVWECLVVCMFDRDTVVANWVYRDLDEEMTLLEGVEEFWENNVLAHIPPEPLGEPDAVIATLKKYSGKADRTAPRVKLDSSAFSETCKRYVELSTQRSGLEAMAESLKKECVKLSVDIISALGNAVAGTVESTDGKEEWLVKYSPRKGKRKADLEKLEALYPEAYSACVSQEEEACRVFSITQSRAG